MPPLGLLAAALAVMPPEAQAGGLQQATQELPKLTVRAARDDAPSADAAVSATQGYVSRD